MDQLLELLVHLELLQYKHFFLLPLIPQAQHQFQWWWVPSGPGLPFQKVFVILKILAWLVMIPTINFPIAPANGGGQRFAVGLVNVQNKNVLFTAPRANVPGFHSLVWLQCKLVVIHFIANF